MDGTKGRVDIIIPTMDRFNTIVKTVESINKTYKKANIIIMVDGNEKYYHKLYKHWDCEVLVRNEHPGHGSRKHNVEIHYFNKRTDWIHLVNFAINWLLNYELMIYASDDLIFEPGCISNAMKHMNNKFPGGDGLICFNQINCLGAKSAFGMMGQKFINRFENNGRRDVFCPNFIHYGSDTELGDYARKYKRMFFAEDCRITHFRHKDSTYREAKKVNQQDLKIKAERKKRGYLWGENFDLVNIKLPGEVKE